MKALIKKLILHIKIFFEKLMKHRLFRELFVLLKYGLVGVVNTGISAGIFFLFNRLGFKYMAYTIIGYAVGIISSFLLNRRYTFKKENENATRQIILFFTINIALLALVQLLQYVLIDILFVKEWIGVAIGMVFYSGTGFILNRNIVFKYKDKQEEVVLTNRITKQIEFIKEIDKMKNILRRTRVGDDSRRENDAEHSWHLAMMAMLLEEYAAKPVNITHVLKMTLVHDLVEIYAGDTFAYDVEANKNKEQRENQAADILFSMLPSDQQNDILSLWKEFDAMATNDALFANAMDRFQPFLSNVMIKGGTWLEGHVTKEDILHRMDPIRIATPKLWPYVLNSIEEMDQAGYIPG